MTLKPSVAADQLLFEREKWATEVELRQCEIAVKEIEAEIKDREVAIKDREQRLKTRELRLKVIELKRSRFTNPLFLAIVGATAAATGTAIGAGIAAWSQIQLEQKKWTAQQELEHFKADSALVLEVIKTNNDTVKAKANLKFLVGTGLITDQTRRSELTTYLDGPGPVPSLPAAASTVGPVRV